MNNHMCDIIRNVPCGIKLTAYASYFVSVFNSVFLLSSAFYVALYSFPSSLPRTFSCTKYLGPRWHPGSDHSYLPKGNQIKPHDIHTEKRANLAKVNYGIVIIRIIIQVKYESRSILNASCILYKKKKNLQNFLNNKLVGWGILSQN